MPELAEIGDELEKSHFKALENADETGGPRDLDRQRLFFKLKILFIQNVGILMGFVVMFLLAIYSKYINF
jgi:hypothetical protein